MLLDRAAPRRLHVAQRRLRTAPRRRARQHRRDAARRARPRRRPWSTSAFERPGPITDEVEVGSEISVLFRCIPLVEQGAVSGAVVLLRDISELRRRDRLLLSKDATIREIHHRVKNNLQTISSLLRLQGSRLASREAKAAIEESVRRVRSIALVHEILSREAGEDVAVRRDRPARLPDGGGGVPFARPPGALPRRRRCRAPPRAGGHAAGRRAQRAAPERVRPRLSGGEGARRRPGRRAPRAAPTASCGAGDRRRRRPARRLRARDSPGLGLSIVRTLVTSELGGSIRLWSRTARHRGRLGAGTVAELTGSAPSGARRRGVGVARRRRAAGGRAYCLRSLRRSSSEVPPQTPESWFVMSANSRHGACAGHSPQTALAWSICSMAGPVVPTGKKRSGFVSRQAAWSRHSSSSIASGSTDRGSATDPPGRPSTHGAIVTCFTCRPVTQCDAGAAGRTVRVTSIARSASSS